MKTLVTLALFMTALILESAVFNQAAAQGIDNAVPILDTTKIDKIPSSQPAIPKVFKGSKYGPALKGFESGRSGLPFEKPNNGLNLKDKRIQGPGVGGGGDVKISPDGEVEIADFHEQLLVFRDQARKAHLQEDRRFEELRRIERLMKSIEFIPGFKSPSVLDESINYFFVDEIPSELEVCQYGMTYKFNTQNGAEITRGACTDSNDTYLVESLFLKLAPSEQLIILYHEDMRRYGVSNGLIAKISKSLRTVIKLLEEQMRGQIRPLSEAELSLTLDLFKSLAEVGLYDSAMYGDKKTSIENFLKEYRITEYGGWVTPSLPLSRDQIVGLFATYRPANPAANPPSRFTLVATNMCDLKHRCEIRDGTKIYGNALRSEVLMQNQVPVATFFTADWATLPIGSRNIELRVATKGSLFANVGYVVFRKAVNNSQFQISAKGLLEKRNSNSLSIRISIEPGYQYVVRFQGSAHRPSGVHDGIVQQPLQVAVQVVSESGENILDSGDLVISVNPDDKTGLLTPNSAINGMIYMK